MSLLESHVIAVDGGQTHSTAVLAKLDGTILGVGQGGSANHFLEAGGPDRFASAMKSCIYGASEQAGIALQPFKSAHYCLTGVHAQMDALLQGIAPAQFQSIQPDRVAALAGATQKRPAVLILSGTGAIAYGIDSAGADTVTGGWGYYMGDEGSAAWIAPRALSIATRAVDGICPPTLLSIAIPEYFGVTSLQELHPLIYTHQIDRVKLAEIARVVGHCARYGDSASIGLLAEAGRHLADAVVAVIRKLGLGNNPVVVTSAGGVFKSGALIVEPMMDAIKEHCALTTFVEPEYPPIIGALILALQSGGVEIDEHVQNNIRAGAQLWRHFWK